MPIICPLDVHRKQVTYEWVEMETGELKRGHIRPVTRTRFREWLGQFEGREAHFILEATTGWRFIVEEIHRAGFTADLAETTETRTRYGRKRRAKTDYKDCEHMLDLYLADRPPRSWIAPHHILELRTRVRLRKALGDERREWQQRLQAQLFHQGIRKGIVLSSQAGRAELGQVDLSPAGRHLMEHGLRMLDFLRSQIACVDAQLKPYADKHPACQALRAGLFGVGAVVSTAILAELGDCRRFSKSDQAVRYSGLDVTVWKSDGKSAPGHLSRQGPSVLRWALYEAAQSAARKGSPDHRYYLKVKQREGHEIACFCVARKLSRRAYHILRGLGDLAMQPIDDVLIQQAA